MQAYYIVQNSLGVIIGEFDKSTAFPQYFIYLRTTTVFFQLNISTLQSELHKH